jgi:hypothetical protein
MEMCLYFGAYSLRRSHASLEPGLSRIVRPELTRIEDTMLRSTGLLTLLPAIAPAAPAMSLETFKAGRPA